MSTSKAPSSLFASGTALPSSSSSGAAVVKLATALAMLWLAARALLACDATSDNACLRFSDCASGLTCANGQCVTPPSGSADGGAGEAASGASSGSTSGASGTSGSQSTSGATSGGATGTGDNETEQSDDSGTTSTE